MDSGLLIILVLLLVEFVLIVSLLPFTWVRPCDPSRKQSRHAAKGNNKLLSAAATTTPAAESSDAAHARKCLEIIENRRPLLNDLGAKLVHLFGFQQASCRNQLEHLESLLVWSISQTLISLESKALAADDEGEEVVFATAIQALHNKTLARVADWREKGAATPLRAPRAGSSPVGAALIMDVRATLLLQCT